MIVQSSFPIVKHLDPPIYEDAFFVANDFVHYWLMQAIQKSASDIHFEPYENFYRMRFRLDGLLCEMATVPLSAAERLTACLKVMAHLDTSERRLPQDGRFQIENMQGECIDCRMSTCPTVNGEKIVVRLLQRSSLQLDIHQLGLNEQQKTIFLRALKQPQGMILVTGPTGSGKTVTLYTALTLLNQPEKNICTVEEPVEIKLPGINQVGVNLKAGLTFSKVLRAFLRQDPDVIMLGEIRDLETAQIAINAAQTGHLVLSTLHANGAVETLIRLLNLGIEPFQVADSVKLIIAQRLVRKICMHCQGKFCEHCHLGYRGRAALFEVLPLTPEFISKISKENFNLNALTQYAQENGMMSLYEAGLEKVALGLTTEVEVKRVVMGSLR